MSQIPGNWFGFDDSFNKLKIRKISASYAGVLFLVQFRIWRRSRDAYICRFTFGPPEFRFEINHHVIEFRFEVGSKATFDHVIIYSEKKFGWTKS